MALSAALKRLMALCLVFALSISIGCSEEEPPAAPVNGGMKIYYVHDDANGEEDGSSWDDAFTDPADAMAVAKSGDQIWVHSGTCSRTAPDPPGSFLVMKPGVKIYGGFDGTETDLSERDPAVNPSTFSGRNHIHTVVGAEGALLDGIRKTKGRADRSGDETRSAIDRYF